MPNTRKILIVDDDPGLRDALTEQLSLHEEFEAVAAENGSKGLQAAKAGQIDLVIMDVGLPDIDGREAARILERFQGADHHAHGPRHGYRHHPRP
jgi:DNA-binding response OmpR family regulator